MRLTRKASERLVLLTDTKETLCYRDIHRAFPDLTKEELYSIIGDSFVDSGVLVDSYKKLAAGNALLYWVQRPANYKQGYAFQPDDRFRLSIKGSDILYAVQKERNQELIEKATLLWAKISAAITVTSIVLSLLR